MYTYMLSPLEKCSPLLSWAGKEESVSQVAVNYRSITVTQMELTEFARSCRQSRNSLRIFVDSIATCDGPAGRGFSGRRGRGKAAKSREGFGQI